MKFIIDSALAGQRLDVALSGLVPEPRSQTQKGIKAGRVKVNQKIAKANYRLRAGDTVQLEPLLSQRALRRQAPLPEVAVIKDTADYVVINKPAGLLVHPARGHNELTLVDWLLKHYPKIKTAGDDPTRPGIVHRLDRDVSGLMVVAKTLASWQNLKQQFQERAVVKEYQALVYGAINNDSGEINFLLARSAQGGKMAARPLGQTGKAALTEYRVTKHFINYTQLKLLIKTGRTHQIRAHLAAFGHPLLGDNLYGTKVTRAANKKFNLGRIWLAATRLAFTDLAGEKQEFKIGLPPELKKVLEKIK